MTAGYTYMWEFIVEPAQLEEFQRQYGPGGAWVALFRESPGYRDTRLLRDRADPRRFITIDRWRISTRTARSAAHSRANMPSSTRFAHPRLRARVPWESWLKPEPRPAAALPLLAALLLLWAVPFRAFAQTSASWTPDDIRVSRSTPGEAASASAHFEVAPDGDARIAIERRDAGSRSAGTVLLIGGRWMVTRGFGASSAREIESLDRAVLDSQLVIVLLTAALPAGPPPAGPPQHVRFAEKSNPIRISTASSSTEYRAPWTVVGTVSVPGGDAAANYQLSFTWSDQGVSRTLDLAGSAGTAKAPLDLPDTMKLAGWKIRRLPQSLESSLSAAAPEAAPQKSAESAATLGELRRLR